MYQRSADMGLGVPFNIASYALLTRLLAHCCDLKPGDFVHSIGDAHVYLNHVEPLKQQLARTPYPFPKLRITCATKNVDEITFADLELVGYKCHKPIKMQMAV
jgi:thymidylate synthase